MNEREYEEAREENAPRPYIKDESTQAELDDSIASLVREHAFCASELVAVRCTDPVVKSACELITARLRKALAAALDEPSDRSAAERCGRAFIDMVRMAMEETARDHQRAA